MHRRERTVREGSKRELTETTKLLEQLEQEVTMIDRESGGKKEGAGSNTWMQQSLEKFAKKNQKLDDMKNDRDTPNQK